ncbi:MAG: POTRA domain-containing protein, partial [Flavobacteriales bacterium]
MRAILLVVAFLLPSILSFTSAQNSPSEVLDLSMSQEYRIGGITVLGAEYTDVQAIKLFSALQIGETITIPGEKIGEAITNLWNQDLFEDINIEAAELRERDIYLVIRVKELPRLTRYSIAGVNRSEQETIKGKIDLMTGRIVNENVIATASKRIKDHYRDKGFLDINVDIAQQVDSSFANGTIIRVNIDKGDKVKIDLITINGIEAFDPKKVKRKMKSTKEKTWWRFYKPSKYLASDFASDQQ